MNRILLLFIAVLLYSCHAEQVDKNRIPNVLFIMADDLGSGELGCYGGTDILTPNIDQLASEGMMFSQAYSGNTVCAPARSTLMTGLHAGHGYVRGNTGGIALPDSAVTMAEVFKKAGFKTGGFGKWGLGEIGTEGVPEQQGFDEFVGYYHQIHAHDYFPDYLYENSKQIQMSNSENDLNYSAYTIFDRTRSFIEKNKDEPFFCYASWTLPHGDFVIPDNDAAVEFYRSKDWSDERKKYAAMVSLLDKQVGELVQTLKDLSLYDNTLIVFCSDNGGLSEFAEYKPNGDLRGFKRDMYEGGLRVPMIARWDGHIPAGITFDMPVYFPDILPTFAEAIRGSDYVPNYIDGLSLLKWMKTPSIKHARRNLYWEYPHYDWNKKRYDDSKFKQAFRTRNWKMIKNGSDKDWEFYNLDPDPNEKDDMAAYHPGKMQKFQQWIEKNRSESPPQVEPERLGGKPYR